MIELKEIKKSFGTGDSKQQVLKGIDLKVGDGRFVTILGASGSGKSTLLNVMSGLERPDSGNVMYDGHDICTLSDKQLTAFRREKIGFVFQQYYLLPHLNVEANVRLGADLVGNKNYREMIEAVGLSQKLKRKLGELSGGEQQRVCIARALSKKPQVLFLDEPTGALDEATGRQVLDYIANLQRQLNFTAIMVTHNRNIAQMTDTVVVMNSGIITDVTVNASPQTAYEIGW